MMNSPTVQDVIDRLAQTREQRDDLRLALKSLTNEVSAAFGLAERDLRAALGNTNAMCLFRRMEEAKAAIAKAEGRV